MLRVLRLVGIVSMSACVFSGFAGKYSIRATGNAWAYRHIGFDSTKYELGVWGDGENDFDESGVIPPTSILADCTVSYAYIKWKLPEELTNSQYYKENQLAGATVTLILCPYKSLPSKEEMEGAPLHVYAVPTFTPGDVKTAKKPELDKKIGEFTLIDDVTTSIKIKIDSPELFITENDEVAIVLTSKIKGTQDRASYYSIRSVRPGRDEESNKRIPLLNIGIPD